MLLAVGSDILKLKSLGQLHIQLNGTALPGSSQAVLKMEVKLRAVERAVALVDNIALAHLGDCFLEGVLCKFPIFLVAHVIVRHGAQLDLVGQAE